MMTENPPIDRARRGVGMLRAMVLLRGCTRGRFVSARGRVHVVARGDVHIGDRVQFVEGMFGSELVCERAGEVVIGARSLLAGGISIRARQSVRIGERCLVASLVSIRDHDGDRVAPVLIGDDVWIAHGACIEPGVTVGAGSIISAGSVVTSDVPPGYIAIGNPASVLPIHAMRSQKEHSVGPERKVGASTTRQEFLHQVGKF
jgi:acetyltransferase-like isoleucine patch superfamily enzyme